MASPCDEHMREALRMAGNLIVLAHEGDADTEDDGCGVLYGLVRDCGYRIRAEAEGERKSQRAKGIWD